MPKCYPYGAMWSIRDGNGVSCSFRWGAVALLAASFLVGGIGLAVGCSGEPPAPVVTEVPVVTVVLAITEVVIEVPVVTEIPAALPPCPTQQGINNTLAWLEEARSTHVIWADYLDVNELTDPLAKQGLGTADFHRLWVARYATMIGVALAMDDIC